MRIPFPPSQLASLGAEWELAIVDAATLEQVPGAAAVLEHVDDPVAGPIRGEFLDSMIELVTGVHSSVAGLTAELSDLLDQVRGWLAPRGLDVLAMGAHPWGDPASQQVVAKEQYRRVSERNAWWGRQLAINGLHIHAGLDDRSYALPLTNTLARLSPYFIALTASSPLWRGEDTGFASQRTMLFQQLPTNGLPWPMQSWAEFEDYATQLEGVGMIHTPSELRWDVRPSIFATVENRAMDCVPTVTEIGAVVAFTQCLVVRLARRLEAGQAVEALAPWFLRENKWRAARYGLEAEVIQPIPGSHTATLRAGLDYWLTELRPIAAELGCACELEDIAMLTAVGPSYLRQRRALERGASLAEVVRCVLAETASGRPAMEWER